MTKRIGKRSVFYLYLVVGTVTTLLLGIVSAAEKDFPRKGDHSYRKHRSRGRKGYYFAGCGKNDEQIYGRSDRRLE